MPLLRKKHDPGRIADDVIPNAGRDYKFGVVDHHLRKCF